MTTGSGKPLASDRRPDRPACAFRVGITGARRLEPEARSIVRRQIREVLEQVALDARAACAEGRARAAYRTGADGAVSPRLRALTPLADGVDRLFAEVARDLGCYELDAALPFERAEYAKDFEPASRAEFERWLDTGLSGNGYLEIDGARDADEAMTEHAKRSYEAVGRFVVRNCDLLVAVWNGGPSKGRGGTGDIVRFAARVGPPVWWIDAAGVEPPRLLRTMADFRWRERLPRDDAARRELSEIVARDLIPPTADTQSGHGLIGRAADRLGLGRHAPSDPLLTYLRESGRPRRAWLHTHRLFFRLVAGPSGDRAPPPETTGGFWERQYRTADATSIEYRDRYRSSYVILFLFAMLAVVCAVLSLSFESLELLLTPLELLWLFAIAVIADFNQRRNWQGRWIAYRLLAELCRKQEALASLGWSLPTSDVKLMGRPGEPAPWVGWYFNALLRCGPLATGRLRDDLPRIRDMICAKLISGQESYHRDRRHLSSRAAHRLSRWGELAFLGTCGIVLVKLVLLTTLARIDPEGLHRPIIDLGLAAAVLPAVSAALFGIRAYAELELLEQQSARLEEIMRDAGRRIVALPLDHPLASQDLAAEVFDLSAAMLQDVGGWAALFKLKVVEAN